MACDPNKQHGTEGFMEIEDHRDYVLRTKYIFD